METKNIKFMWNGIKVDGKLIRAGYSISAGPCNEAGDSEITIYARQCSDSLPTLDSETVINNTDIIVDYFERDKMRVSPTSRWYQVVKAAAVKRRKHDLVKYARRAAKCYA